MVFEIAGDMRKDGRAGLTVQYSAHRTMRIMVHIFPMSKR